MSLKQRLSDDVKAALIAKDRQRLAVLRMILAAVKQREVDERIELDDADVIAVLDFMAKQRRDSLEQFEKAGRDDLAGQERFELTVLADYLPEQLSEAELIVLIDAAINTTGAESMRDMGKVMALVKDQLVKGTDMKVVSATVRSRLGA